MQILLTGATGALGSVLLPKLLEDGHQITVLARGQENLSPLARINALLPASNKNRVNVIEGDVIAHSLMNFRARNRLVGKVDKIIHAAADVRFDEQFRTDIMTTNHVGTMNMIALARELKVKEFLFVSTAYVAGNQAVFSEDDLNVGQQFRNPYEESKYFAELAVRNFARSNNIRFSIFRPSIIVGSSIDGAIRSFDGYYGFFKSVCRLTKGLRKRIENPEERTIVLSCGKDATLNLVQMDWVVSALAYFVTRPACNRTYHLTHPDPPLVSWVIQSSMEYLGIQEYTLGFDKKPQSKNPLMVRIQRGVNDALARYRPYTHGVTNFISSVDEILPKRIASPPAIDKVQIALFLDYAVAMDWGEVKHQKAKVLETA